MGVDVLIALTRLGLAPFDTVLSQRAADVVLHLGPLCLSLCWPRQHEDLTVDSLDLAPVRLPTSAAKMRLPFPRAHGCWCHSLASLSAEDGALARRVQACRGLPEPLAPSRWTCTVRCQLPAACWARVDRLRTRASRPFASCIHSISTMLTSE